MDSPLPSPTLNQSENLLDNPYVRTGLAIMLAYLPKLVSNVPSFLKTLFGNNMVRLVFLGYVVYSSVEERGEDRTQVTCVLLAMVLGAMMYFRDRPSLEATTKRRMYVKSSNDPQSHYLNNGDGLNYNTDLRTRVNAMKGTLPYFDSYTEPEARNLPAWNQPNRPLGEWETNLASEAQYEVPGMPLNSGMEKMSNTPNYDVNNEEELSEVNDPNEVLPFEPALANNL